MDWDRRRFDERRGGESYRPAERTGRAPSRGYDIRHRRSSPRTRSPPRQRADTWVPSSNRGYGRPRSRSPPSYRRRSRTPIGRNLGPTPYERRRSPPRRFSPRRDERIRSPPPPHNWRSKSPYSDGRSRNVSRARNSPRRSRDTTPGSQVFRPVRRDGPAVLTADKPPSRVPSPGIQPEVLLPQSPFHVPRRDHPRDEAKRDPTSSPSRHASPMQGLASQTVAMCQHSSPIIEKSAVSSESRSRSPVHSSVPSARSSKYLARSPYRDQIFDTDRSQSYKWSEFDDRPLSGSHSSFLIPEKAHLDTQTSGAKISGSIPTQPKNHGACPLPPSGSYQGSRPSPNQHHGSQHVSLLSAPTRPRRGPGPRESWMGTPSVRRGPATTSQIPPAGPRASFSSPTPGGGYRHPTSRQSGAPSVAQLAQRGANHLAGLCTIVPEGRSLPSLLDPTVEKRLVQLELDKEKLLEQIAETQRSKRAELRDWDRLDRESSICALKSELAEGHLQRMADESIGGGTLF